MLHCFTNVNLKEQITLQCCTNVNLKGQITLQCCTNVNIKGQIMLQCCTNVNIKGQISGILLYKCETKRVNYTCQHKMDLLFGTFCTECHSKREVIFCTNVNNKEAWSLLYALHQRSCSISVDNFTEVYKKSGSS